MTITPRLLALAGLLLLSVTVPAQDTNRLLMTNTIATYGGNPYLHLVEMARRAQKGGVIIGILLHQGESNTNDKEWPVHFTPAGYRELGRRYAETMPPLLGYGKPEPRQSRR